MIRAPNCMKFVGGSGSKQALIGQLLVAKSLLIDQGVNKL